VQRAIPVVLAMLETPAITALVVLVVMLA